MLLYYAIVEIVLREERRGEVGEVHVRANRGLVPCGNHGGVTWFWIVGLRR